MKTLITLLLLFAGAAHAEPAAVITAPGLVISLFDEDCKLEAITNLPLRATWTRNGKTLEGCFGIFRESSAVGAYFEDKTMVVAPLSAVQKVLSI